jgi:hypothetical protein
MLACMATLLHALLVCNEEIMVIYAKFDVIGTYGGLLALYETDMKNSMEHADRRDWMRFEEAVSGIIGSMCDSELTQMVDIFMCVYLNPPISSGVSCCFLI